MKVVHNLGWYFPESCGGTEIYVRNLASRLEASGITNQIIAPISSDTGQSYRLDEISVWRFPIGTGRSRAQIRGETPHDHFDEFGQWLADGRFDIYHQHSWTYGCGLSHLEYAKRLGLRTVVTIHVPGSLCLRGTMMLFGSTQCDGRIEVKRCSECWAASRGIHGPLRVLTRLPLPVAMLFSRIPWLGRLGTILSTPKLVREHQDRFEKMARLADRIVAVADWLQAAVQANNIPREKILVCRQGVDSVRPDKLFGKALEDGLRVGYLGRLDPLKGVHIIVEAVKRLPTAAKVKLIIHGIKQAHEQTYEQGLSELAGADPRITFAGPVPQSEVLRTLQSFDVLAVPSQCVETGPLVAMEAIAAGIPVMGSDLGGIRETVKPGVTGWLLPHADVDAWTQLLARVASQRKPLAEGISARPHRTMDDVAFEMRSLYQSLLN